MKNKKIIWALFVVIAAVSIIGYNYVYQDHRDIQSEKAAYTVKAIDLAKSFQDNEKEATAKYLNKTIVIEGSLSNIEGTSVVLENVVFFALNENETVPSPDLLNTIIQVKGRCIGYDSLLEEVKLDQASLLK